MYTRERYTPSLDAPTSGENMTSEKNALWVSANLRNDHSRTFPKNVFDRRNSKERAPEVYGFHSPSGTSNGQHTSRTQTQNTNIVQQSHSNPVAVSRRTISGEEPLPTDESPIARMRREKIERYQAKSQQVTSPTSVACFVPTSPQSTRTFLQSEDKNDIQLPTLSPRKFDIQYEADAQGMLQAQNIDTANEGSFSGESSNSAWMQGEMARLYQSLENKTGMKKDSEADGATSAKCDEEKWIHTNEPMVAKEPQLHRADEVASTMLHHDDSDFFVGVNSPSFDSTNEPKFESLDNFSGLLFGGKEPSSKMNHLSHDVEQQNKDDESQYTSESFTADTSFDFHDSTETNENRRKSPTRKKTVHWDRSNEESYSKTNEDKQQNTERDGNHSSASDESILRKDGSAESNDNDEQNVQDIPTGIMMIVEIEDYFSSFFWSSRQDEP